MLINVHFEFKNEKTLIIFNVDVDEFFQFRSLVQGKKEGTYKLKNYSISLDEVRIFWADSSREHKE